MLRYRRESWLCPKCNRCTARSVPPSQWLCPKCNRCTECSGRRSVITPNVQTLHGMLCSLNPCARYVQTLQEMDLDLHLDALEYAARLTGLVYEMRSPACH